MAKTKFKDAVLGLYWARYEGVWSDGSSRYVEGWMVAEIYGIKPFYRIRLFTTFGAEEMEELPLEKGNRNYHAELILYDRVSPPIYADKILEGT